VTPTLHVERVEQLPDRRSGNADATTTGLARKKLHARRSQMCAFCAAISGAPADCRHQIDDRLAHRGARIRAAGDDHVPRQGGKRKKWSDASPAMDPLECARRTM